MIFKVSTSSFNSVRKISSTNIVAAGIMSSKALKIYTLHPTSIVKYIIGEGGKNIKELQEKSKCKMSINNNNSILISGENDKSVENGWKLVEETVRSFGWRYSRDLKVFHEIVSEGNYYILSNTKQTQHSTKIIWGARGQD